MKLIEVARRYTPHGNNSRRQCTRVHYVKKGSVSVRVCKNAFLRIHGVSNGRLDRALRAQAGGSPHCDQRGRHEPGNKTKTETLEKIRAHINSFPHYTSHYSHSENPKREFLSPCLTIQKMYALYREMCEQENMRPASEWVFRKVFNEEFNLSFGRYAFMLLIVYTHACIYTMHTCIILLCIILASMILYFIVHTAPNQILARCVT